MRVIMMDKGEEDIGEVDMILGEIVSGNKIWKWMKQENLCMTDKNGKGLPGRVYVRDGYLSLIFSFLSCLSMDWLHTQRSLELANPSLSSSL